MSSVLVILEAKNNEISRISWTITDWFRTNAYYASGGWRATWDGEGGGVLLNLHSRLVLQGLVLGGGVLLSLLCCLVLQRPRLGGSVLLSL